jgi:two-component system sensor histidine kinase BaeS
MIRHSFRHRLRHHRGRHAAPPFVVRLGCALVALIAITAIAASTVMAFLSRSAQRVWPLALAAGVAFVVLGGFLLLIRLAAKVFAEQVRLRRQLMADVAHELRTPLTILQGRIEGLLDGIYPRDDARLSELLAETQHLSRLVEDVRTLANAEAGALELRRERIDLAELIRDAAAALGARIDVDVPSELVVDADPVRIREVVLNLLTNAVEHAPECDVSIAAVADARSATITVRDNGPGIAAEALPHVFDRFHKGRTSRGSGLGLAIAQKLVLAHGGTIALESAAGAGTTVRVTLPR